MHRGIGLIIGILTVTEFVMRGVKDTHSTNVYNITQQALIHWDTTAGVWLARSNDEIGITGIAAIAEFHLSSAVSNGDQLTGFVPTATGAADFVLGPAANRFTASYITTGVHVEIGQNQNLRVAGVFPLSNGIQKFFDAEVLVQFGRRY